MTRFRTALKEFRDDESGLIMAEFIVILPILVWALMAFAAYWDVFRSMNTSQKATYAISDLISRQRADLSPTFLGGMTTIMEYLLPNNLNAVLRFTSVKRNTANTSFEVIWSRSTDQIAYPAFTTVSLQSQASKIPVMAATDTVMIVESFVPYVPAFKVGLANNYVLDEFIVTRPRVLNRICLEGVPCV
jgi:Flp pilus assembly protein TadG